MKEACKVNAVFKITMFKDPYGDIAQLSRSGVDIEKIKEEYKDELIDEKVIKGNIFLNEGINFIWTAVCGGSITPFDSTHAHIGVGDGTTPADPSQTGLQGVNKCYAPMDSGYPIYGTDQKVVFRATFDGTMANFTWNEWTVANGPSDSAVNLNRKVESLGTKSEGTTWIFTVELSLK